MSDSLFFYETKSKVLVPIHTLSEWEQQFKQYDKSGRIHWKPGRSAHALAQFMLVLDGLSKTINAVKHCLVELMPKEEHVGCIEHPEQPDWLTIDKCIIEKSDVFDGYPNPRRQDLVIYGHTCNGRKFKIACEAKVDEPFGPTIEEAWQAGMKYRSMHPRSHACDRITGLLDKFKTTREETGLYRYQLLHFMAGANNETDIDMTIMLVMVFRTHLYDETKGRQNYNDFKQFVEHFGYNDPNPGVFENYRLQETIAENAFAVYWYVM